MVGGRVVRIAVGSVVITLLVEVADQTYAAFIIMNDLPDPFDHLTLLAMANSGELVSKAVRLGSSTEDKWIKTQQRMGRDIWL